MSTQEIVLDSNKRVQEISARDKNLRKKFTMGFWLDYCPFVSPIYNIIFYSHNEKALYDLLMAVREWGGLSYTTSMSMYVLASTSVIDSKIKLIRDFLVVFFMLFVGSLWMSNVDLTVKLTVSVPSYIVVYLIIFRLTDPLKFINQFLELANHIKDFNK